MKIRKGFVSNSSSSSFIIQWKCNMLKDGEGLDMAMVYLFDLLGCGYDEDFNKCKLQEDWIDKLDEYESHLGVTIKQVIDNSKPIGKSGDMFETEFFTSMRNDVTNYGLHAANFLMALIVDEAEHGRSRFEVVHIRTEDMGG